MGGWSVAAGEDAPAVAQHEGHAQVGWDEALRPPHVERNALAAEHRRQDLGVTGQLAQLAGGDADAAFDEPGPDAVGEQPVVVDHHADAGAVAAVGRGVLVQGGQLGQLDERVGAVLGGGHDRGERVAHLERGPVPVSRDRLDLHPQQLGVGGGQVALDVGRAVPVVGEGEAAPLAGHLELAFEAFGLGGLADLRGDAVEQVAAQPAELDRVERRRLHHHLDLGGRDLRVREVVGQGLEHAGDRARLLRAHPAVERRLAQQREPLQPRRLLHQPAGLGR